MNDLNLFKPYTLILLCLCGFQGPIEKIQNELNR